MDSPEARRRKRAGARKGHFVIHRARLAPIEHDPSPVRGAEAISLVSRLTRESWSLGGLELPAYPRSATPFRFVPGRPR
jgi:hypothetical protein